MAIFRRANSANIRGIVVEAMEHFAANGSELALECLHQIGQGLSRCEDDSRSRLMAIGAMGRLKDVRSGSALLKLASHDDSDIRYGARDALRKFGIDLVPQLCKVIEESENEDLLQFVVRTLGTISDPGTKDTLLTALVREDASTQECAAESLGNIGLQETPEALFQAADSEHAAVAVAALRSLATMGDQRAAKIAAMALESLQLDSSSFALADVIRLEALLDIVSELDGTLAKAAAASLMTKLSDSTSDFEYGKRAVRADQLAELKDTTKTTTTRSQDPWDDYVHETTDTAGFDASGCAALAIKGLELRKGCSDSRMTCRDDT